MARFDGFRYDVRRMGLAFALAQRLSARVKRWIGLQVLLPNTLSLRDANPSLLELEPPLEFRVLSLDECMAMAANPANQQDGLNPGRVRIGYARGETCYALFEHDRMVSFGWFAGHRPGHLHDGLVIHCAPQYRYFFWGCTPPEFRGRRLHGIGIVHALRHVTEHLGAEGMIGYIDSNNHYSLRSAERLGYHFFGKVYILKLFGRYLIHATRGCKRYGVTVTAENTAD